MIKATERPILFSADMVRTIIDGRKTKTRRIIKKLPAGVARIWHDGAEWNVENANGDIWLGALRCPYGQPGDRLWVRETWAKFGEATFFKADNPHAEGVTWKPSIHIPRAASRITLEITDIRAERLLDISEADAIAEGLHSTTMNGGPNVYYDNYMSGNWFDPEMLNNPISSFLTLWEKINGTQSIKQNPFVWVIQFEKI